MTAPQPWPGPRSLTGLPAAPDGPRRWPWITGITVGGLLLLARLVLPAWPYHGHSLNEVHGYCSGALGAFLQGLGGKETQAACSDINNVFFIGNIAAGAGLVLAAVCAWFLYRRTRKA